MYVRYIYSFWLMGCLTVMPAKLPAAADFNITELATGRAIDQTIMTAFLGDPGRADMIVVSVSEKLDKKLELYELQDEGYAASPSIEMPLSHEVISIDVGRIHEQDSLVIFTGREAIQYDPRSGTHRTLINYQSIYNTPVQDSVPNLDLFRDLNQDGRDDFFIPGFSGATVYIQQQDGSFSKEIAMYAPPTIRMNPGYAEYQVNQNYFADMNLDNLQDAVFWVDDRLSIYPGRKDGLFDQSSFMFDSDVPFEYGSYDEMDRFMDKNQMHSDFNARALSSLADLDNDGITDLIVMSVKSEGLFDKSINYEIYSGRKGDQGKLEFSKQPVSRILAGSIPLLFLTKDFNSDKKTDFLVASVEISLGKIIKALFSGSADIDLNFYQMVEHGYPEKPNASLEINVRFDLKSGKVSFPTILSADLDVDGYEDLIIQRGKNTLQIYSGVDGEQLFDKDSMDIRVDLPETQNGNRISGVFGSIKLVDLNHDEKPDILIRHESKTETNRVIVLLSK